MEALFARFRVPCCVPPVPRRCKTIRMPRHNPMDSAYGVAKGARQDGDQIGDEASPPGQLAMYKETHGIQ